MSQETCRNVELASNTDTVSNDLLQLQKDAMAAVVNSDTLLQDIESTTKESVRDAAIKKLLEKTGITVPFPLPSPPQIPVSDMVTNLLNRRGKPPRMPNEFFIYRKALVKELKAQGHKIKMTEMSRLASHSWKQETRITKAEYRKIAREIERKYTRIRSDQAAALESKANDPLKVNPITEIVTIDPLPTPFLVPDSVDILFNLPFSLFNTSNDINLEPITLAAISLPTPNSVTYSSPGNSQLDLPPLFQPFTPYEDSYTNPIENDLFLDSPVTYSSSESESFYLNLPNASQYSPTSTYAGSIHSSPINTPLDYEAEYIDFQLLQ